MCQVYSQRSRLRHQCRGILPFDGLYREAQPERGSFARFQVYERVGITLAEVCERAVKSVVVICERAHRG